MFIAELSARFNRRNPTISQKLFSYEYAVEKALRARGYNENERVYFQD